MADVIVWTILVGLTLFASLALAGTVIGVVTARRNGDSVMKGGAKGLLKGVLAFMALCGLLWVLGMTYIAFSFLMNTSSL